MLVFLLKITEFEKFQKGMIRLYEECFVTAGYVTFLYLLLGFFPFIGPFIVKLDLGVALLVDLGLGLQIRYWAWTQHSTTQYHT